MDITVREFLDLFNGDSQTIQLWDCDLADSVYVGNLFDVPSNYMEWNVTSLDPIQNDILTLNICR